MLNASEVAYKSNVLQLKKDERIVNDNDKLNVEIN